MVQIEFYYQELTQFGGVLSDNSIQSVFRLYEVSFSPVRLKSKAEERHALFLAAYKECDCTTNVTLQKKNI